MSKPLKAKPLFYANCLAPMQQIAFDLGYNLLIHGSMNRDMDLVAIPWEDEPKSHLELLQALETHLKGSCGESIRDYMNSLLPGGRQSYIINLNRAGSMIDDVWTDPQYYLDISITPLVI